MDVRGQTVHLRRLWKWLDNWRLWTGVSVGIAVLIFVQSSQPALVDEPPIYLWNVDKLLHFTAWLVLSATIRLSLSPLVRNNPSQRLLWIIVAIMLAVSYGAIDEIHQSFVPSRTADLLDLLADSAGSVVGVIMADISWHLSRPVRSPGQ